MVHQNYNSSLHFTHRGRDAGEYRSYDDLLLFLNAEIVAKALGVLPSSGYESLYEPGFPVLCVGRRMVVPKKHSSRGVCNQTGGGG